MLSFDWLMINCMLLFEFDKFYKAQNMEKRAPKKLKKSKGLVKPFLFVIFMLVLNCLKFKITEAYFGRN